MAKKPDDGKWVKRDSKDGQFIKKSEKREPSKDPKRNDTGRTSSTGPRKK